MDEPTAALRQILTRNPRDVVIVVGAGVTIGALKGSPLSEATSWRGLLGSALERIKGLHMCSADESARIRALLDDDDSARWIEGAELITQALGGPEGGEMRAWLRDSVGAFSGAVRVREVLEALRDLHERGAILATVNYDGLLEQVTGARPVTWRETALVERVIRGDERGILHLHGYWEDPASVVLGSRSYDAVAADLHARAVLQALRMTKTLLFVGHGAGLRDPNWGSLMRWMEEVFARSEYRHYRLVRADERERVQSEHRPGQRVFAVPYGTTHEELAPFLRALAVADPRRHADSVGAGAARRTVVLRLNIGGKEFDWLSEGAIRAQVRREFGDSDPVLLPELRQVIDREAISPREWRALAVAVTRLRDEAKGAVPEGEPVRYVVAGQAPLPVFAFLGQLMQRMSPITVINRRPRSDVWDVVGPMDAVEPGADFFTKKQPELGRVRRGRVVLSIQCSNEYPYQESMIEPLITEEGGELLCSYEIANESASHQVQPMTARELRVLQDYVREAMAWMKNRCGDMNGLMVAIGGPCWVAFWIGFLLNPNVLGYRVDFPNLVGGEKRRYVRALSSPMNKAPWLAGKAKLMFVGAEPDDGSRTGGARAADAIGAALERELGRESELFEPRVRGAVMEKEFLRELDLFRPDILHLHLHGTETGERGLVFEDELRRGRVVPAGAVIDMIRSTRVTPALVVLSACHSAALAPLFDGLAECVVSMTGKVAYATATDFASAFYGALARGRSLEDAILQGKSAVHAVWGKAVNEQIVWRCAPGVNAEEVVLLPGRSRAMR